MFKPLIKPIRADNCFNHEELNCSHASYYRMKLPYLVKVVLFIWFTPEPVKFNFNSLDTFGNTHSHAFRHEVLFPAPISPVWRAITHSVHPQGPRFDFDAIPHSRATALNDVVETASGPFKKSTHSSSHHLIWAALKMHSREFYLPYESFHTRTHQGRQRKGSLAVGSYDSLR